MDLSRHIPQSVRLRIWILTAGATFSSNQLSWVFTRFTCLMCISSVVGISSLNTDGFVVQLIHITSPLSPFYNPNAAVPILQNRSTTISATRNKYLYANSDFELVPPSSHDFVMRFSLRCPSTITFEIPDTASDLVWLQCGNCATCVDKNQTALLYDIANSFSHKHLRCDLPTCQWFPNGKCSLDGHHFCTYEVYYPDNSYYMGVIGMDGIFSYQMGYTNVTVDQLFFGCGTYNFDSRGQGLPGVIGLRKDSNISLLGQLSNPSFSYCHNVAQFGGYIKFGSNVVLGLGIPTPLIPNPYRNYHLRLEGIRVDGENVDFTSDYFEMDVDGPLEMGFIIDTGTTYTLIYSEAFDQLLDALKNSNPLRECHAYQGPIWELCFDDISNAPEIELLFTCMSFPLSDENAWIDGHDGLHCLAMQRTLMRLSMLGMYQQRSINAGFDMRNAQVWFSYQDNCPE